MAPDENTRANEFDLPWHELQAEERSGIDAERRLRRTGDRLPIGANQLEIPQAEMRYARSGVMFDDDPCKADRHSSQAAVNLGLDAIAHEIDGKRPLR